MSQRRFDCPKLGMRGGEEQKNLDKTLEKGL